MSVIENVYKSLKILIDYMDAEMEKKPTRELADLSNELQRIYDKKSKS